MEIGIIGAGAAGVALLDALSLTDTAPGGVTVFEESPWLWRGRAYQPDLDAVRVNAPPVLMSIRHSDRDHYTRWLAGRTDYPDVGLGVQIVPRVVFGEYLEATAREAIARLRSAGWRVSVVNERVVGAAPLRTASGEHRVDRTVLAVGGGSPFDHYGLTGSPGFVLEPYPLAHLDVPADAHVAVIGSGLTAVDVVAALTASGHTGPVTLVSRTGVLPHVQQRPVPLDFRHLVRDNLVGTRDGLLDLLRAELAESGQDLAPLVRELTTPEDPVDRLRRQLSEVDSSYLGRRLVTAAVHMLGSAAWRLLPALDRESIRREHFRTINSLASPMVPLNGELLLREFDSGRLRLLSGVTKVERAARGFRVVGDREVTADVVVNAVNPQSHAVPPAAEPLVGSLLAAGLAALPPAGGLEVRSERVLSLGAVTAETSFVVPSVPTLAAGAAELVKRLSW
ncbi:FAD/NAD(P)-binding protein [Saccharothrix variisporea]|uniref:Putative NAD(P)/FAD-binding protein YdhS n=1 Tax=Saccharothrix variisporea TaxID=543527 RepID=A0A495X4B6_9PSEU|nr:FAD/NAD(P)-binding protein [Saccharothrix variisporea]RKT67954.1 putative NAD(P)/FAD-binding protein YdhS [Saccharothrix variisporea]